MENIQYHDNKWQWHTKWHIYRGHLLNILIMPLFVLRCPHWDWFVFVTGWKLVGLGTDFAHKAMPETSGRVGQSISPRCTLHGFLSFYVKDREGISSCFIRDFMFRREALEHKASLSEFMRIYPRATVWATPGRMWNVPLVKLKVAWVPEAKACRLLCRTAPRFWDVIRRPGRKSCPARLLHKLWNLSVSICFYDFLTNA